MPYCSLLVVINDFYIKGSTLLRGPLKANPPLVIDSDAVLTLAVSLQGLKPVSRWLSQILDGLCKTDCSQSTCRYAGNGAETSALSCCIDFLGLGIFEV